MRRVPRKSTPMPDDLQHVALLTKSTDRTVVNLVKVGKLVEMRLPTITIVTGLLENLFKPLVFLDFVDLFGSEQWWIVRLSDRSVDRFVHLLNRWAVC